MTRPADDLSVLLSAVSDPRRPAPELLVRYADDPASLSDAERTEVEEAVEGDPLLAGELRTLQTFRFPERHALAPRPRESQRWRLRGLWLVGPLAASAAALFAVFCQNEGSLEPTLSVRTQQLGTFSEPPIFSSEVPAPSSSVSVATASPPVVKPELPVTKPHHAPVAPAADAAVAAEPVAPVRVAPPAPVALAFLEPEYRPPPGAAARYRVGGGTRAGSPALQLDLEALAPPHVAFTRSPAPSLFWSLTELPDAATFQLTLSAAMTPEPVLERTLPRPEHPGLQRIRLASYGVELDPGVEYTWTISADVGGSLTVAQGWIERTEAGAEADASASPGERPALYAAAGLWYDAVESLADLAERYPEEGSVAAALKAFAASARLEAN